MSVKNLINLCDATAQDQPLIGNKAWCLAQLLQAGFPVAPGFCIPAVAADGWRPQLRDEVLAAYRALGGNTVAVRSSALEEDGLSASYAGIYQSVLGVSGEQALLAAIEQCLLAWHTPLARQYRKMKGANEEFSLAILVQTLIPATAAGVAYTCNPLEPQRRRVLINAVWGLAEPLAAGRVAADSYQFSRKNKLLDSTIVAKPTKLGLDGETPVSPERILASCLSPAQAAQVSRLALRAEAFFGIPQDVEFAVTPEKIWVVQSRPIVAINWQATDPLNTLIARERKRLRRKFALLRQRGVLRGHDWVLSNGNIGELLPTPTVMSFGLFKRLFAGRFGAVVVGRQRLGYSFDARCVEYLYELVAGQPYFNLEVDAVTFSQGATPPVDYFLERVLAQPELANYPELNLYNDREESAQADALRARLVTAATDFLQRFSTDIEPGLRLAPPEWSALSPMATVAAMARLMHQLRRGPCVQFVIAARLGFYFAGRLRTDLLRWFGEEGEHLCASLLVGLPGSLVTRQCLWLEMLSDGRLSRAEFLAAYGHTADNELELSEPRLSECPQKLDRMLHELRASRRRPTADFAHQVARRQAVEQSLEARLLVLGASAEQRSDLRVHLHFAQQLLPLRETIKHHYIEGYAAIRGGLLHLASSLGWKDDLIFQLRPSELRRAAHQPQRLWLVAQKRKEERQLACQILRQRQLPSVIVGSRLQALGQPPALLQGSSWQGAGLSSGRVCGIAQVIDARVDSVSLLANQLTGREILVLRSANLGLAPLFRRVAGLIVEVGGLLAHSACQAREAGIPAVVLPDATRLIADGSWLWLDGNSGQIALASHGPEAGHVLGQEDDHVTL